MESNKQLESESWQQRAACKGIADNTGSFYPFYGPPSETTTSKEIRIRKAKAFCGSCVVSSECLEYALSMPDNDGVWGGLDSDERRSINRRNRRAANTQ